jgi:hypothetical protein
LRLAALAFGVVAGLVASLILALGGLDPAALAGVDPRQVSLIRFGLFIIANFGVLGAGVVLAAPLAGSILFILGAIAWIAAALVLRHGPDYVMLVPPALLLVSAAFGIIAFLRRPQPDYDDYEDDERAMATQRAAMAIGRRDDEEEDPSALAVGASFFGDGGTATPMHGAMSHRKPDPVMRREEDDDWQPVRRRTEPPRQKPMFRSIEDEYDEEPGFWRVSRITSSVLSFGLYGALVAAALLIFLNLRSAETRPAVAKIEPSAPILSAAPSSAPRVAAVPTVSQPPSSAQAAAVAPTLIAPSTVLPPSSFEQPAPVVAEAREPAASSSASAPLPSSAPASSSLAEAPASSAEPPPEDLTLGEPQASGALVPFPMSPRMAAARIGPATRRPAPTPAPRADAGL